MAQKTCFILILLAFAFETLTAQITFYGRYGNSGDYLKSCIPTSDKGFIMAGSTTNSGQGSMDMLVIKVDSLGNQQWAKTYGDTGYDYASSIVEFGNKEYVLCGSAENNGYDNGMCVCKIDSAGNIIWANLFQQTFLRFLGASCIKKTNDGGFIVIGSATTGGSVMTYDQDIVTWKLDSLGNFLWAKRFVISGDNQYGTFINQTADSGFILLDDGKLIIKTDVHGNKVWGRYYLGTIRFINYIEQSNGLGYLLTGTTWDNNGADGFIMKIDSMGFVDWTKFYGGTGNDGFNSGTITNDNGFIAVGGSNDESLIIKTELNGDTLWTRGIKDSLSQASSCINETQDELIVMGIENASNYFMKTDLSGNSDCYQTGTNVPVQSITIPSLALPSNNIDSAGFGQNSATIISANAGTSTTSCLSLNSNNILENDFTIYPNPSNGTFHVELISPMKNANIKIVNVLGITIMDFKYELLYSVVINSANLTPGFYWINIFHENQKYTKKILIQY
jgi:hypothetical protein